MAVRVGIIGVGDGGMMSYDALQQAGAEVVALCDINEDVLRSRADMYGAPREMRFYTDYRQMFERSDVDLVVIATPDHLHLMPASEALDAGKYVFVEKPLATQLVGVQVFRDLADEFPGKLIFGENQSFSIPVQSALRRMESDQLGRFLFGTTFYVMAVSERIMSPGSWRTTHPYNPCAGGLSHNFMTALLFAQSPIARVRATGSVLRWRELEQYGGYDTMEGTLEFATGARLNWHVCLGLTAGEHTLFGGRDMAHLFQFERGALAYGQEPRADRIRTVACSYYTAAEPESTRAAEYFARLYCLMHRDTLAAMEGKRTLHTIDHGINVAAACALAFESAKHHGGNWIDMPEQLQRGIV